MRRERRVGIVVPWEHAPGPEAAFVRVEGEPGVFFRFAAGGPADLCRWSYLAFRPDFEIRLDRVTRPAGGFGPVLARCLPKTVRRVGPRIPFAGGFAGFVGYEARSLVERVPPPRKPPDGFPVLSWRHYAAVLAWDRRTGRAYVAGVGRGEREARAAIEAAASRILRSESAPPRRPADSRRPRAAIEPSRYRAIVADVRRRIRAGDFFQANVSQRFDGRYGGRAERLFLRLARAAGAPFATFYRVDGERAVLAASPERYLSLAGDRVETRPMKGTRPRGTTPEGDRRRRTALASSEKDRAELAMIVDLCRNDLGRACRAGTVRVAVARRLERYETVHQAVGVVVGRTLPGRTLADLLDASFPPGSVTGAPKIEATNAIDRLEGEGRGPYCGAVGWIDEGGDADLAVAIRTMWTRGTRVSHRVGGGVTWLSDPEAERRETLDKGAALARAVGDAEVRP